MIFINEEISLFEDAFTLSVVQTAVSHLNIVMKQLLRLLSWKPVRYLNLVNANLSHVERTNLRLYSLLVDFASALFRFAQVAYE